MSNILIVEDEEILRQTLKEALKREGHSIDEASDFETAGKLLESSVYDITIFDIKLPGGDGMDLLSMVKEKEPETQVIMMTAHGSIRTAVSALKEGACDYLIKPLDIDELRLVVRKAIESAKTAENFSTSEQNRLPVQAGILL